MVNLVKQYGQTFIVLFDLTSMIIRGSLYDRQHELFEQICPLEAFPFILITRTPLYEQFF